MGALSSSRTQTWNAQFERDRRKISVVSWLACRDKSEVPNNCEHSESDENLHIKNTSTYIVYALLAQPKHFEIAFWTPANVVHCTQLRGNVPLDRWNRSLTHIPRVQNPTENVFCAPLETAFRWNQRWDQWTNAVRWSHRWEHTPLKTGTTTVRPPFPGYGTQLKTLLVNEIAFWLDRVKCGPLHQLKAYVPLDSWKHGVTPVPRVRNHTESAPRDRNSFLGRVKCGPLHPRCTEQLRGRGVRVSRPLETRSNSRSQDKITSLIRP